jgi:hypothetical protein
MVAKERPGDLTSSLSISRDTTDTVSPPLSLPSLCSSHWISPEDGELSDDVLRDVVINFMIAGRDTTANVRSPPPSPSLLTPPCSRLSAGPYIASASTRRSNRSSLRRSLRSSRSISSCPRPKPTERSVLPSCASRTRVCRT